MYLASSTEFINFEDNYQMSFGKKKKKKKNHVGYCVGNLLQRTKPEERVFNENMSREVGQAAPLII